MGVKGMSESEPEHKKIKRPVVRRMPPWLKKKLPADCGCGDEVSDCLSDLNLETICKGARCPNRLECRTQRRAAFLLMGTRCTRGCRFCAMASGDPQPLDPDEPRRVAEAVQRLVIHHAVITSVTRDDLPDGGAAHFAATVAAVKEIAPRASVEILVPDFWGDEAAWAVAADSIPEVFNHNIETVERLYEEVRPGADFDRSLALLDFVKERHPEMHTKSGMMLGLGEELEEVVEAAKALRDVGVDIITVGQYMRPASERTLAVKRYVTPEEFMQLEMELQGMGFEMVACSPWVRSSYNAEEAFLKVSQKQGEGGSEEVR